MGIHHQAHGTAGQWEGNLEARPLVGDGPIAAHQTFDAVVEERIDLPRQRPQGADAGQVLLIAHQGRHPRLQAAVGLAMVERLDPGPETGVGVLQAHPGRPVDFAQELIA